MTNGAKEFLKKIAEESKKVFVVEPEPLVKVVRVKEAKRPPVMLSVRCPWCGRKDVAEGSFMTFHGPRKYKCLSVGMCFDSLEPHIS